MDSDGQLLRIAYTDEPFGDRGHMHAKRVRTFRGTLHRLDGPAAEEWYTNGQRASQQWVAGGDWHRLDGPAWTSWFPNGQIEGRGWYQRELGAHRLVGPAKEMWYENGQIESQEWWVNGELHRLDRLDGPVVEEWDLHGRLASQAW